VKDGKKGLQPKNKNISGSFDKKINPRRLKIEPRRTVEFKHDYNIRYPSYNWFSTNW
jgi:hypothetical protein